MKNTSTPATTMSTPATTAMTAHGLSRNPSLLLFPVTICSPFLEDTRDPCLVLLPRTALWIFKRFMSICSTYRGAVQAKRQKAILILYPGAAVSMKVLWIAVLLCAGAVLALAVVLPGGTFHDRNNTSMAGNSSLNGSGEINLDNLLPPQIQERDGNTTNLFGTVSGNKTALFAKYVSADTRYIIVSLYSG